MCVGLYDCLSPCVPEPVCMQPVCASMSLGACLQVCVATLLSEHNMSYLPTTLGNGRRWTVSHRGHHWHPVSLWENKASSSRMGNSVLEQVQSGTTADCLSFLSLFLLDCLSLKFDVILVVLRVLLLEASLAKWVLGRYCALLGTPGNL